MAGFVWTTGSSDASAVRCGSASILDDLLQGSYFAWITVNSIGSGFIASKGVGINGGYRNCGVIANTSFHVTCDRQTTDCDARAAVGNFSAYPGLDRPFCFAGVFNTGGANGDQRLYIGNSREPLSEPSSYGTQTVGSGTVNSSAANDQMIGNNTLGTNNWDGIIFSLMMWNKVLTIAELRQVQNQPTPLPMFGPIGCWILGTQGSLSVVDLSGNGNHGLTENSIKVSGVYPYPFKWPIGEYVPNPLLLRR